MTARRLAVCRVPIAGALLLAACFRQGSPDTRPATVADLPMGSVRWQPSWPGTHMAVVRGDPSAGGEFTFLFRMPDGYWIHPHTHPVDARLRVLSGTLLAGMGERLDTTAVRTVGRGDSMQVARGTPHFEGARGETVLEVSGTGAWGITFLDPSKDPSRAAPRPLSRAALNMLIDSVFAAGAAAGLQVAVVQGDSILLERALGIADMESRRAVTGETRFLTASTTKAFTALAAISLDEQGAVDLDASLAELLPAAQLDSGLSARDITLRDLLAMRSGLGQDGPVVARTAFTGEFDTPTLLRLLRYHPPSRRGRRFEYGNLGYNVAALALEQATGRPWQRLVEETVLEPLGMRETVSRLSALPADRIAMPHALESGGQRRIPLYKSDRTLHAAGGHLTTARDLARLAIAHLNQGKVPGARGVPASAIAASERRETDQDRQFAFLHRNGWGLGLDIADYRGDTLYERNGSFTGYYSHFSFMPSRGIGVVVLANSDAGGAAAEAIAQGVYDLAHGDAPVTFAPRVADLRRSVLARTAEPPPASPPRPPLSLARYAGRYTDEVFGTLVVEQRGDSLIAHMGDSWGVLRADTAANTLAANLVGGTRRLAFEFRGNAGPAQSVTMAGRTFRRSAVPPFRR
jgi:CubicO group peptidase (beta-lactamase class C family)/quercetin dioxygenase-like cupin family protein